MKIIIDDEKIKEIKNQVFELTLSYISLNDVKIINI